MSTCLEMRVRICCKRLVDGIDGDDAVDAGMDIDVELGIPRQGEEQILNGNVAYRHRVGLRFRRRPGTGKHDCGGNRRRDVGVRCGHGFGADVSGRRSLWLDAATGRQGKARQQYKARRRNQKWAQTSPPIRTMAIRYGI
jgi:hypothetical protein